MIEVPQVKEVLSSGQFLFAVASLTQLGLGAWLYPWFAWGIAEETFKRRAARDPRGGMRLFLRRPPAPKALAEYTVFVVRATMILRSQFLAVLSAFASFILVWREASSMQYASFCFWGTISAIAVAIISMVIFLWQLYRGAYDPLRKHSALGVYLLVLFANALLLTVGVAGRLEPTGAGS